MATDPVRDEAERLVAAAIAALSVASRTLPGRGIRSGFATGSEECCVCPVCRAIAAMREPNPEFAERLATGAADLATGVASLLRSLSRPTVDREEERPSGGPDPWHEATTEPDAAAEEPPAEEPSVEEPPAKEPPAKKPMAKKAVKKAAAAKPEPKGPKPEPKGPKKAAKKPAKKAPGEGE